MLQMMSSNVALLHSNSCCVVLEPAICEDLDLHVAIFFDIFVLQLIYLLDQTNFFLEPSASVELCAVQNGLNHLVLPR